MDINTWMAVRKREQEFGDGWNFWPKNLTPLWFWL